MKEEKRNYLIDIIRLFCAILVVSIHTSPFACLNNELLNSVLEKINCIAVPMFLLISGAFFWDKVNNNGLAYIKKYFKRIMIIYLFWSILYAVYIYFEYYNFKNIEQFIKLLVFQLLFYGTYVHLWYFICVIYCIFFATLLIISFGKKYVYKFIFYFFFIIYLLVYFFAKQYFSFEAIRIISNMPFFFLGTFTIKYYKKNCIKISLVFSFILLIIECTLLNIGYYPFSLYLFLLSLFNYINKIEVNNQYIKGFGYYSRITSSIMYTSHFFIILLLEHFFITATSATLFIITIALELIIGCLLSKIQWKIVKYII